MEERKAPPSTWSHPAVTAHAKELVNPEVFVTARVDCPKSDVGPCAIASLGHVLNSEAHSEAEDALAHGASPDASPLVRGTPVQFFQPPVWLTKEAEKPTKPSSQRIEKPMKPYKWNDPMMENLYHQLNAAGVQRETALYSLIGQILSFSLKSKDSSRVVQRAFDEDVATLPARACFVQELHGSVLHLIDSRHGNYVFQKILEVRPAPMIAFVAEELSGKASQMACHEFGCRVLPRLFTHIAFNAYSIQALVNEILIDAVKLCRHRFGYHTVQAVVEYGSAVDRMDIIERLGSDLAALAKDRSATYVIKAVLEQHGTPHQWALAKALLAMGLPFLASLKKSTYGVYAWRPLAEFVRQQSPAGIASLGLDPLTVQEFNFTV